MPTNLTGQPNTDDYNLGRGILYFALLDIAGKPGAWRDLGNAPSFTITQEAETLEHQSSREGLKVTDKEVVISQAVTCAFTLDEVNSENLALLFSGAQAAHTNVAIAGFTEFAMVPNGAGTLQLGRWYDLVNSSGERAYDVLAADLTVKTNITSPATMVLGTDYLLDSEMGRIFIIHTSSLAATAIADSKGLLVTLTARAGARTVEEVRGLTQVSVKGALKFISSNPANDGQKAEYTFHQVTLKADGDISLIGDDWTTMPFTCKAERNAAADADSPYMTYRSVNAA